VHASQLHISSQDIHSNKKIVNNFAAFHDRILASFLDCDILKLQVRYYHSSTYYEEPILLDLALRNVTKLGMNSLEFAV